MRKCVIVLGYDRPRLLNIVCESLFNCIGLADYDIIFSLDGSYDDDCVSVVSAYQKKHHNAIILANNIHFGVLNHARNAITVAVANRNYEAVVYVEDDTVLSPDALDMCDWFWENGSAYIALNLWSNSKIGQWPDKVLKETNEFNPWGFALRAVEWEHMFSPHWYDNKDGWDWSIRDYVSDHERKLLVPAISRTYNIGSSGTHETPEHYDEFFKSAVANVSILDGDWQVLK